MSKPETFNIDFTEAKDYTTFEGIGGGALLKQNGMYAGVVTKLLPRKTAKGDGMMYVVVTLSDADEKGQQIGGNVMCTGKDRNGDPMSRQLWALIESMGFTQAQVQGLAANGVQSVEAAMQLLINKPCHMQVESEVYDSKETSKVKNWITVAHYNEAIAAGAHRQPRAAQQSFTGTAPVASLAPKGTNGAGGPPSLLNIGGAPSMAPSTDPLARIQSGGLKI